MSRFYVGQRVKLVRGIDGVSPAIKRYEGVIAKFCVTPKGYIFFDESVNPSDCDCLVVWDGCADVHSQHIHQLEPILPEGWKPVEWSACLWSPEGLAA